MKLDNANGRDEQEEPMTLLEEFSAQVRGGVQFAKSHLGKAWWMFDKKESATAERSSFESGNIATGPDKASGAASQECSGEKPLRPGKVENGREELLQRLFADETELDVLRTRLQREGQERKELEAKIAALTASKVELEKRLAKPSVVEEKPAAAKQETKAAQQAAERGPQPAKAEGAKQEFTPLKGAIEQLNREVTADQEIITELKKTIARNEADLREARARASGESSDYERRLRESAETCARLTTELEQERAERRRAQERIELAVKQSSNGEESVKVKDYEAKLQKETAECQRLAGALAATEKQLQEQAEQNRREVSRLQSGLDSEQAKQKRLEMESLELRCALLDAARTNLANANKVRRQMLEAVEKLIQNMRRLLEGALESQPKALVESMLEQAGFLKSKVQEFGRTQPTPANPDGRNEAE